LTATTPRPAALSFVRWAAAAAVRHDGTAQACRPMQRIPSTFSLHPPRRFRYDDADPTLEHPP
jgi:hypothetical protein